MTNILCIGALRTKIARVCYDTEDSSFSKQGRTWYLKDICIKFVDSCNAENDYDWADIICGNVASITHPKVTAASPESVVKELYYGSTTMYYAFVSDYDAKFETHSVTKDDVAAKEKLKGWFTDENEAKEYLRNQFTARINEMERNLKTLKDLNKVLCGD